MAYNFMDAAEIAKKYGLDEDELDEVINSINHAYYFHRCPLPKPSEDPIPALEKMALNLIAGCRDQREFDRLETTAQAYDALHFLDAEEHVEKLIGNLEALARLLAQVPRHGGKRPMDVNEFFAVRKLCALWEKNHPEDPVTSERQNGIPTSMGASFVCDVIECVISETRSFKKPLIQEREHDFSSVVRGSVMTQIRNYIQERGAAQKVEQQTPPAASV